MNTDFLCAMVEVDYSVKIRPLILVVILSNAMQKFLIDLHVMN